MRAGRPPSWRWILAGAIVLPLIYLPSLTSPFDFADDGNLVYAAPAQPIADRLRLIWQSVTADFQHRGPFRPAQWVYYVVQAELLDGNPLQFRMARLLWAALAAGMLLWLFSELRIHPGAALLAAAMAMWNPFRGEIWRTLAPTEGIGMPFGLVALVCAIRAARSAQPLPWDVAGIVSVLIAMACKNTFAAVVPAQMLLRIMADGISWRAGWRRHDSRALWIATTLLLPVGHLVYFRLQWHAGQHELHVPTLPHLGQILKGLSRAMRLEVFAPAVALTAAALIAARKGQAESGRSLSSPYRAALIAGAALLLAGIGTYLPARVAMAGRYTVPAAWGLDLGLAVLCTVLLRTPSTGWKRAALVAFSVGLTVIAVRAVALQAANAARSGVVWQALRFVEREAPPGAGVAWTVAPAVGGDRMGEAIHFGWHLGNRSRRDLRYGLIDDEGRPHRRPEIPGAPPEHLDVVVTTDPVAPRLLRPDPARWERVPFRALLGRGRWHECYVWIRRSAGG